MVSMLHITNGDSAADLIRQTGLSGDVLPWRDPMHHGPVPADVGLDELSRLRIHYLSGGVEGGDTPGSHGFTERDATVARASEYDEVILWFEHDLLDQLQILQILDYFSSLDIGYLNLSIICIDEFEGFDGFRGLGQLSAQQIKSLFPARQKVTQVQLQQSALCWKLFRQPDPAALQSLIGTDIPGLPFMRASLLRHCQDFPWVNDGLTRTERQLLNLVADGETRVVQLFIRNMDLETCLYIGDARTFSILESLCNSEEPLLQTTDQKPFKHLYHTDVTQDEFRAQCLTLTDFGRRMLAGEIEVSGAIKRDEWLGGVHLQSLRSVWYWDEKNLVFKAG